MGLHTGGWGRSSEAGSTLPLFLFLSSHPCFILKAIEIVPEYKGFFRIAFL
jgi:hypothetical protein